MDIWGRLLQGERRRLWVHDARPYGWSDDEPELLFPPTPGDEMVLVAWVVSIGDSQVALTADRRAYLFVGDEELDERAYCLHGRLLTLDPPTLHLRQAVPVMFTVPGPHGQQA